MKKIKKKFMIILAIIVLVGVFSCVYGMRESFRRTIGETVINLANTLSISDTSGTLILTKQMVILMNLWKV